LTHENFPKRQVLDIGARLQLQLKQERARRFLYEGKEVEAEGKVEGKVGCSQHKSRQTSKPSHLMHMTVRFARFSTCIRISFMLLAITLRPLHGLEQLIVILLKW
jgi:hypothetical protein